METAVVQAGEMQPALFEGFASWIDRSAKTEKTYLTNLRQFAAWLRYRRITKPGRQDVVNWRDWLGTEHDAICLDLDRPDGWSYRRDKQGEVMRITCKPATVAGYLRAVQAFTKWTAAAGLYPDIAATVHPPKIRTDIHHKDALTVAELHELEQSITVRAAEKELTATLAAKDTAGRETRATEQGKRMKAMYLLATTAGLRTVELHRANVRDFQSRGGESWLYVWGKGHAEADQKKAIAPEVAAAVRDYLRSRSDKPTGSSPLFVSTGNRSGGKRIAVTTISTLIKTEMRAAGFDSERITPHTLRHSTGTSLMEITGDLYATQRYMRHSNPKTTEIYLHTDTEKKEADLARRIYDYQHGKGKGDAKERLAATMARLSPDKLDQLATIAAAMV